MSMTIDPDWEPSSMVAPYNICQPNIRSVSVGGALDVELNLKDIVLRVRNTEYNPKRINAVFMRTREPRATGIIFRTGKVNVVGAHSIKDAFRALRKFSRIIKKIGYKDAILSNVVIHNILATFVVPFLIHLEGIAHTHYQFSTFEPELFPALIYRMMSPKVTFQVFSSGKVTVMGAKTRRDAKEAFQKIYPVLKINERPNPN